jgi:endonuclease YncB( thermonuclease family)
MVGAPAAAGGEFTYRGGVVHVVDGDTLDVVLNNGRHERVRLIGIDTPERGECREDAATARARRLAGGARVVLRGDATQDRRDRYGRLLAYVWLPQGHDLGLQLLRAGLAEVYVFERPFRRLSAYERAQREAQDAGRGRWAGCPRPRPVAPPPASAGAGCSPHYLPCVRDVSYDLDCKHVGFRVRVVGADPYRLDGDDDGFGCEEWPARAVGVAA